MIGLLLLCSWGLKNNIDCIAASFIRKPSDVLEIRSFCEQKIKELSLSNATVPLIISKIESTEGLENFHDILKVSDAIMVARGDLGVEIPLETLTAVQKEIVSQCNRACKPVIVATQMLESMQKNPRPTRAEVTDVANAVLDGADVVCCLCSAHLLWWIWRRHCSHRSWYCTNFCVGFVLRIRQTCFNNDWCQVNPRVRQSKAI